MSDLKDPITSPVVLPDTTLLNNTLPDAALLSTPEPSGTGVAKTLATSLFMKSKDSFETARRELYQKGIKTSYNEDLVIFSALHTAKNSMNNLYIQECNGLVLERDSWEPIAVPPRTLRFTIDTEASNKFLHQGLYHVYKAQDGTCFNMYYYNNKWNISTARGYSMDDVKWNADKTYREIICECLEKIGLTWETFTSQLNIRNCYSFGFRHPSMQKFREGGEVDIYRLWFIQSVCLDVADPKYLWSSDISPLVIIPNQELHPSTVGNLRELYKLSRAALQNYFDKKEVCYGFILRSVNIDQTGEHSDLFIESSLLRQIRRTWYENNIIEQCHKSGWNKETAITMHAFLDVANYENFTKLFPEYDCKKYEEYLSDLSKAMALKTASGAVPNDLPVECKYSDLADVFLQTFKVRIDMKNYEQDAVQKIYYDYLRHTDSLEALLVGLESSSE